MWKIKHTVASTEHHFISVPMVVNKLSKIIRQLPRTEAINSKNKIKSDMTAVDPSER